MKSINIRQQKILSILEHYDSLSVSEISRLAGASEATIRRDLIILSEQNLLLKFHGGAKSLAKEIVPNSDEQTQKAQYAIYACSLVEDRDVIFINTSSTAILMLKYLTNKQVTVITNNTRAVNYELGRNIELIVLGGMVLPEKKSIVGHFATDMLSHITANKCFLGVGGLSAQNGLGTTIFQEARINKMFLDRCGGEKVVLTDSSKFGNECNFISAPATDITHIITDSLCPVNDEQSFINLGVQVIKI
ncbi:MAG: hypothetical protein ATN35_05320 [Epulopiscium sp. Nele67-Bin004]|nr:MAG: hypothetical protein ATN35_05320 [Epulopiscium sp. Nele67-Bin004]